MRSSLPTSARPLLRPAVAAAAVCAALVCAPSASANLQYSGFNENGDQHPGQVGLGTSIGANAARQFVCWCSIEPSRGRYSWTYVDTAYNALQAQHVKPLFVVVG